MKTSSRRPFQNMTSENWQNLALTGLAVFFLLQIGLDIIWGNTCGHLGTDYCAFWSAGYLANSDGYMTVYNLKILGQTQLSNFPKFGDISTFAVSPIAYLPIFILPFQLLALLTPISSFWIWTIINLIAFIFYLRFFIKSTTNLRLSMRLLAMLCLSLPVYWNFLDGQVNVWLMICVGEFMRAAMSDQPLRAGLWLGGLLLKPQTLILIGIALLLRRSVRILIGLAASSTILIGSSLALLGPVGFWEMLQIWLGFTKGMPTNDVDSMMNWRMLGFHLSNWISPLVGWAVAGIGMLLTTLVVLYLWRKPIDSHSPSFTIALLGTLAATGVVAWHSHIHMAMFLIPPLIFLYQTKIELPKNFLEYWVLLPSMAYFIVYILASLIKANVLPSNLITSITFIRGASEFGMNLFLVGWAVVCLRQSTRLKSGENLQQQYTWGRQQENNFTHKS